MTVVVAFILVVVSIMVLVLYVHHIGKSLRVSALIEFVGRDTRKLLEKMYPEREPPPDREPDRVIVVDTSGVVTKIACDDLVGVAHDAGCMLQLVAPIGEFVPAGAPLFRVHGQPTEPDEEAVLPGVALGLERTLDQDVAYGLRMLVDIAERSLADSPFSTRPPPSKQSTGCTTACASSPAGFPRRDASRRRRRTTTGRAVDGLGRIRAPRIPPDPARRRWLAPSVTPTAGRARRPPNGRTAGSPTGPRTPDRHAVIVDYRSMKDPRDAKMALNGDRQGLGVAAGSTAIEPTESAVTLPNP